MSLPPVTVQIKRKATDEPVDFLRVHEPNGKRQRRATDFVFSRKAAPDPGHDSITPQPTLEGLPGAEPAQLNANSKTISNDLTAQPSQAELESLIPENVAEPSRTSGNSASRKRPADHDDLDVSTMPAQVRRFHMSRASTKTLGSVSSGGIRKRAAVFVERKGHPRKPRESLEHQDQHHVGLGPSSTDSKQARPQKKPGLAARLQAVPANNGAQQNTGQIRPSAPRDVSLPSGLTMPWDVNSEQLAAEMQAYTLQEIGKNLAEAEAARPGAHLTTSSTHVKKAQSSFKPKKPALRYQERHPEEFPDSSKMEIEAGFIDDEVDDDSEYVIDIYIRMPVDDLVTSDSEKKFGLLVLDSQPDIDEFYLEDSDSDEPEDEDDDDENAENHYTADYPDDEVESDDEYGRNPYLYRNHNASDLEEFDEDDAAFSDDEVDAAKYPWASRPWMRRPEDRGTLLEDGQDK